jgi:threonyl-tRNA synthetase
VQVILLTVTDPQIPYGDHVFRQLLQAGVRVEKDFRNEKLGLKIREAEMQKIPYMVVLGDREVKQNLLAPRGRNGKNLKPMALEEFVRIIREECQIGGESYS